MTSPSEHRTVIFLASTLVLGGAEKVIKALAIGLPDHGLCPHIICLRGLGRIGRELSSAGVNTHFGLMRTKFDPLAYFRLYRMLRRERDAILVSLDHHDALFWGAAASRGAGIRWRIAPVHSTGLWGERSTFSRIDRLVLNSYDRIVALSPKHADYVALQGGIAPSRIVVISNGIDTDRFHPAESYDQRARIRESIGMAADEFAVAIVAALRPEKNHEMFLRAASEFRSRGATGTFLVVGGGVEAGKLQALARELALQDVVHFLGPRDDVDRILAACDVSVLCSHPVVETFPLSVLESMAAGLAMIVTPVGSIPEMINDGDQGIMVPAGDARALAEALLELSRNPGRRKEMGNRARALVVERFSETKMVAEYARLFHDLAGDVAKGTE